jgi:hypothetical protein
VDLVPGPDEGLREQLPHGGLVLDEEDRLAGDWSGRRIIGGAAAGQSCWVCAEHFTS